MEGTTIMLPHVFDLLKRFVVSQESIAESYRRQVDLTERNIVANEMGAKATADMAEAYKK